MDPKSSYVLTEHVNDRGYTQTISRDTRLHGTITEDNTYQHIHNTKQHVGFISTITRRIEMSQSIRYVDM
jgi:hypothetical protein